MKLENRLFTPGEIQDSINNGHAYIQRNSFRRMFIHEKWEELTVRYWEEFNALDLPEDRVWIGPVLMSSKGHKYAYWATWHGPLKHRRSKRLKSGTPIKSPYYSKTSFTDVGVDAVTLELVIEFDNQFAIGRQQIIYMNIAEKVIHEEYEEAVAMLLKHGYSEDDIYSSDGNNLNEQEDVHLLSEASEIT